VVILLAFVSFTFCFRIIAFRLMSCLDYFLSCTHISGKGATKAFRFEGCRQDDWMAQCKLRFVPIWPELNDASLKCRLLGYLNYFIIKEQNY
jgi:hypothetical protein